MKTTAYRCAFCEGRGKDPYDIPSAESSCQVCKGRGKVSLGDNSKNIRKCTYCEGFGKHPIERLTCPVCKGYGIFEAYGREQNCLQCGGSGKSENSYFPCAYCKGYGVIRKSA